MILQLISIIIYFRNRESSFNFSFRKKEFICWAIIRCFQKICSVFLIHRLNQPIQNQKMGIWKSFVRKVKRMKHVAEILELKGTNVILLVHFLFTFSKTSHVFPAISNKDTPTTISLPSNSKVTKLVIGWKLLSLGRPNSETSALLGKWRHAIFENAMICMRSMGIGILRNAKMRNGKMRNENAKILCENSLRKFFAVHDLGAYIDSAIGFAEHVTRLVRTCYFHIHQLRSIRRSLTIKSSHALVRALVLTRLDYCNGLLGGAPKCLFSSLSGILRAAARLILLLPQTSSV